MWAKSTTKVEFQDMMKILNDQATPQCAAHSKRPLYMYDNNSTQRDCKLSDMGLTGGQHVSIPPHSPDFNKPIEHVFNQIKRTLLDRLYRSHHDELTPAIAQQWVLEAFQQVTTESIQKDIDSLLDTWSIVAAFSDEQITTSRGEIISGSEGDYPASSKYR